MVSCGYWILWSRAQENGEISFAFVKVGRAEQRKWWLIPLFPPVENPNLLIAVRKQRREKWS